MRGLPGPPPGRSPAQNPKASCKFEGGRGGLEQVLLGVCTSPRAQVAMSADILAVTARKWMLRSHLVGRGQGCHSTPPMHGTVPQRTTGPRVGTLLWKSSSMPHGPCLVRRADLRVPGAVAAQEAGGDEEGHRKGGAPWLLPWLATLPKINPAPPTALRPHRSVYWLHRLEYCAGGRFYVSSAPWPRKSRLPCSRLHSSAACSLQPLRCTQHIANQLLID